MRKNILFLLLSCIATFCSYSCSKSDNGGDSRKIDFAIYRDATTPNFVRFEASEINPDALYDWIIQDDSKQKTNSPEFFCYFEKKGTYTVALHYLLNGKTQAITTQTVTISDDSYYFLQNEGLWWNDEFGNSGLNYQYWNFDQGTGVWGNNEWQTYTNKSENAFIRDGKLVLKAIKPGVGQKVGDYTSARVTTKGKKEISRGRVEVRAKLPGGVGIWPAIWLFGTKASPYYSELDIMEYVGCDKDIIYGAIHTTQSLEGAQKISASKTVKGVEENFHVYGMNWTGEKIEFYLDTPDNIYLHYQPEDKSSPRVWPFDKELYLILNIAVGGDWGGMRGVDDSIFPCEMEIDYVRVFRKK
ncbi:MAG: glycoside hydrolase family 16 protein [Mediterranea sp.]|jgi:beta-glucanase (GH16 family)|nr:glycoside hydrolase family 16 protein [Mediterranea sp.]